ncbi:hypothetical protein [Mesorhizobium sp. A623]
MALPLTKLGRDVFAPATAGGAPRGADMGDASVLTTEYEALLKAIIAGAGGITLLPDLIYAQNTGTGTADAIIATAAGTISTTPNSQLVTVNFTAPNTGPMTISINGETPRALVLNVGGPISAGYVKAGMAALVQLDSAGNYRLFSYGDATAIQAAVEAALASFRTQYLGAYSSAPSTDPAGGTIQEGAFYWNTTSKAHFYWDGDSWEAFPYATVADGAIISVKLANDAVTSEKLVDDAVTIDKIAADAKDDFRLVDPNGPRTRIGYYNATGIQIVGERYFAMGGFRAGGRFKRNRVPVFPAPAFTDRERHIISLGNGTSTPGDLFAETRHTKSTWYALFAAANDGDATATLGFMPVLRSRTVAGDVVTFNKGAENVATAIAETLQFATNALAGTDALVVSETIDSRSGAFSYRVTTITANSGGQITLADAGSIGFLDAIIPAPPGFDHYRYLGMCYMDTAEVRNIADTGTLVSTRGAANATSNLSGAISTPKQIGFWGHISPLATAVKFAHADAFSGSGGDCVIRYGTDGSNHDTDEFYYQSAGVPSPSFSFNFENVAFSFSQHLWFYSGGALNTSAMTRTMNMRGWLEP